MKNAELSPRLCSAADFVRQGAVFADVGTDHAHLPLFLLERGIISRAICSDVNPGPLQNAVENAKRCGFSDKIDFVLTNGAAALSDKGISDIAICGMGGELIAEIVENAPFLKNSEIRLILQPMTKQSQLRKYLLNAGFSIIEEKYSSELHRNYVTILAEYSGKPTDISEIEAEIGFPPYNFDFDAARLEYVKDRLRALEKAARGKIVSGENEPAELYVIHEIKKVLKGFGYDGKGTL